MPKRKRQDTPEQQSARFRDEAQKLIDAGELSPIEAEKAVDQTIKTGVRFRPDS